MRFFIELSYKGTNYHGWQTQLNATSVQAEVEKALCIILQEKIEITGSSRTDTGVHAMQQFAHSPLSPRGGIIENLDLLVFRTNAILPKDIAIKRIFQVPDDFHARFDATHRKYIYRIIQEKNPFLQGISYYFRSNLDIAKMNDAGKILTQHLDYQAFSKVKTEVKTFDCQIEYAYWERQDEQLLFHIKADRFLRGMVRAIVGTMIEIGTGRLSVEDFGAIILSKNRKNAGRSVPAEGLTLVEVGYDFLIKNRYGEPLELKM